MVISTQTTCSGIARPDFVSKHVISCKARPKWMPRFKIPKQCWTTMASNQGSSFQGMLERVQRYKPDLFSLPRVCLSVEQLHLNNSVYFWYRKYEQSLVFTDWELGTHLYNFAHFLHERSLCGLFLSYGVGQGWSENTR